MRGLGDNGDSSDDIDYTSTMLAPDVNDTSLFTSPTAAASSASATQSTVVNQGVATPTGFQFPNLSTLQWVGIGALILALFTLGSGPRGDG